MQGYKLTMAALLKTTMIRSARVLRTWRLAGEASLRGFCDFVELSGLDVVYVAVDGNRAWNEGMGTDAGDVVNHCLTLVGDGQKFHELTGARTRCRSDVL